MKHLRPLWYTKRLQYEQKKSNRSVIFHITGTKLHILFFFPTDKAMACYTLRDPTASINKTKLTSYCLSHLKPKVVKGSYLHSLFRHSKGKYCLIFLINLHSVSHINKCTTHF